MLRRMLLIPPPEREYNKELVRILADSSIPEDQKLARYNQILRKYLHYSKQDDPPILTKTTPDEKPTHKEEEEEVRPVIPDSSIKEEEQQQPPPDILASLTKRQRNLGRDVLDRLVNHQISWLSDGTLLHKGVAVPSSDVREIVKYVIQRGKKKSKAPVGYNIVKPLLMSEWEQY